jgi:hypothetical protein
MATTITLPVGSVTMFFFIFLDAVIVEHLTTEACFTDAPPDETAEAQRFNRWF